MKKMIGTIMKTTSNVEEIPNSGIGAVERAWMAFESWEENRVCHPHGDMESMYTSPFDLTTHTFPAVSVSMSTHGSVMKSADPPTLIWVLVQLPAESFEIRTSPSTSRMYINSSGPEGKTLIAATVESVGGFPTFGVQLPPPFRVLWIFEFGAAFVA
jgi:hypothetical protein